MDKLLYLFAELGELLSDFKVSDHTFFIGNLDGLVLLLQLENFCTETSAIWLKYKLDWGNDIGNVLGFFLFSILE